MVNNSVAFSEVTMLCSHHVYLVLKHLHHPKQSPVPTEGLLPIPPPPNYW